MPTEFPLPLFPKQLLPDVELDAVTMDETTLTISVSDSEWAISRDIEYFFGPGEMIFSFTGQPTFGWKKPKEEAWHKITSELLEHLTALERIERADNESWLFYFSHREKGYLGIIILEAVTKIEWTGEVDEKVLELGKSLMQQ